MALQGEQQEAPGAALVMAAAPAGRMRLVDATSVLPSISAVPSVVLTGTIAGTVVQLVNPADPQAVLAQVRTAANAPGPLTFYFFGQLHLDRRQQLPHIALADTQPATVRYSAFPWAWLAHELKVRRAPTVLFVDLVADEPAWQQVTERPLNLGPAVTVLGTVSPPRTKRRPVEPAYAQALAALLRAQTTRPPLHELHQAVLQRAGIRPDTLILNPPSPAPVTVPAAAPRPAPTPAVHQAVHQAEPAPATAITVADPHPAILEAARAGRHSEAASAAAAWEQYALRTYGAGSREAVHWIEVRADLARLAGDSTRSCELWLAAATARLTAGQPPDDPMTEAAVDRAHHQWEQTEDTPKTRELLERLMALRHHVPGRQPGALDALQRRAKTLETP